MGTWTYIAATLDTRAGLVTFCTNGVLAASATTLNGTALAGRSLRQTTLPVVLGWTPDFTTTYAAGQMDEVRIWSVTRTAAEIQRDMPCRLCGDEFGLEAYWNFDSGAPVDLSGNGHHGTLAGDAVIAVVPGGRNPCRLWRLHSPWGHGHAMAAKVRCRLSCNRLGRLSFHTRSFFAWRRVKD